MKSAQTVGGIVVAVRIRPLSKKETESGIKSCCETIGDNLVAIKKSGDAGGYLKSQLASINEYAFDAVFDENSTQSQVFEKSVKPFIPNLIMGQNVTVFAYGATGAGKTHTMLGNTRADESASKAEAGIIPHSLKEIFKQIGQKEKQMSVGESYTVSVCFMEVYNEQVYDLLETSGKVLSLREDQEREIVVVAGITEQSVSSYDQVIEYLHQGNRNRKTESTMANSVSSRSHAILQLNIKHVYRHEVSGRDVLVESKLSLIDLAGSERASATNNRGARLQEGANINKSLLALANCINALAENSNNSSSLNSTNKKLNVKYRDSKLTHLLKSSLEGNCNLVMIANINPSDCTYDDSLNTLKYANRAKNIKVNPTAKETNKETNWVEREAKLRDENSQLRAKVAQLEAEVAELRQFKATTQREKKNYGSDRVSQGVRLSTDSVLLDTSLDSIGANNDNDLSMSGLSSSGSETNNHRNGVFSPTSPVDPDTFHRAAAAVGEEQEEEDDSTVHAVYTASKALVSRKSRFSATAATVAAVAASLKSSMSVSIAAVPEEQGEEDEVEALATVSKKRRASCLPTNNGGRTTKRTSISGKMTESYDEESNQQQQQPVHKVKPPAEPLPVEGRMTTRRSSLGGSQLATLSSAAKETPAPKKKVSAAKVSLTAIQESDSDNHTLHPPTFLENSVEIRVGSSKRGSIAAEGADSDTSISEAPPAGEVTSVSGRQLLSRLTSLNNSASAAVRRSSLSTSSARRQSMQEVSSLLSTISTGAAINNATTTAHTTSTATATVTVSKETAESNADTIVPAVPKKRILRSSLGTKLSADTSSPAKQSLADITHATPAPAGHNNGSRSTMHRRSMNKGIFESLADVLKSTENINTKAAVLKQVSNKRALQPVNENIDHNHADVVDSFAAGGVSKKKKLGGGECNDENTPLTAEKPQHVFLDI